MNYKHRVDVIRGNSYMGTEHWEIGKDGLKTCFLFSNKVNLSVGDLVETDDSGNVYKDGVLILDAEKERRERLEAVEAIKQGALIGGSNEKAKN